MSEPSPGTSPCSRRDRRPDDSCPPAPPAANSGAYVGAGAPNHRRKPPATHPARQLVTHSHELQAKRQIQQQLVALSHKLQANSRSGSNSWLPRHELLPYVERVQLPRAATWVNRIPRPRRAHAETADPTTHVRPRRPPPTAAPTSASAHRTTAANPGHPPRDATRDTPPRVAGQTADPAATRGAKPRVAVRRRAGPTVTRTDMSQPSPGTTPCSPKTPDPTTHVRRQRRQAPTRTSRPRRRRPGAQTGPQRGPQTGRRPRPQTGRQRSEAPDAPLATNPVSSGRPAPAGRTSRSPASRPSAA